MQLPTQLLQRKLNTHKGDFGHVFIIAGSLRYSGAAILCSKAAIRSGAGLVTLGIPKSLNNTIIKVKPSEVMTLPLAETIQKSISVKALSEIRRFIKTIDVVALGPGISNDLSTQALVLKVISESVSPLVLDADALNVFAGHKDKLKKLKNKNIIITPHLGEMSRLLGISVANIQDNREKVAKCFAKDYNLIVVLKGHKTVVADSKGNLYINTTGNPGMATAGSGDVLTGIIASFIGQGLDSFNAAKFGVYLHGLAGDIAAKEKTQLSLIASDIIDKLPQAIKKCS